MHAARTPVEGARPAPSLAHRHLVRLATTAWCWLCIMLPATASAAEPPAFSEFSADSLADDPLLSSWFSGVTRVEWNGQSLFSVHSGVDGAGNSLHHDSIFWLGSNSKMLVSAMLLQRVDEGLLSLDDPVSAHIEGLSEDDLSLDGVSCTLRLLLAHQCGLPRDPPTERYARLLNPVGDPSRRPGFIDWVRQTPLSSVPGSRYAYSNVGYTLAGILLTEAEDDTLDAVFQRRIAGPLALTRTGFDPSRIENFEDYVAPLTFNLGPRGLSVRRWFGIPETAPSLLGSAGGAFATPEEYARLLHSIFRGDLLSDAARSALITPVIPAEGEQEALYALGVGVEQHEDHTRLRHQGALIPHGFSTHMLYIPEWNLLLVTMSNRSMTTYSAGAVSEAVFSSLEPEPYVSPFPDGTGATLGASAMGIIHLIVLPLLLLSMLVSASRWAGSGMLFFGLMLGARAWVVLLFRGTLSFHTGDGAALGVTALLLAWIALCLALHTRRREPAPLLPPGPGLLRRAMAWPAMLAVLVVIGGTAVLGRLYTVQTLVLLALPIGYAVWRARAAAPHAPSAL